HESSHPASMGPPLFSGGNRLPRMQTGPRFTASMGPPLFSGGNLARDGSYALPHVLQWGRRCSAAEIGTGGGDIYNTWKLQWGRRCSAAEIETRRRDGHPGFQLQWGRRCSAAEMPEP